MARKKGTKTNAEKKKETKKKAKEDNKKSTRKKTPTFTQKIKMQVDKYDAEFIDSKMYQMNRRYNSLSKHAWKLIEELRKDAIYLQMLEGWKKSEISATKIFDYVKGMRLSEYSFKNWLMNGNGGYQGLNTACVQELADDCWAGVKKCLFDLDKKLSCRKQGQTNAIRAAQADRAIIYNPENHTVKFMGRIIRLKPIRRNDIYMAECMMSRIKYCAVERVNSKKSGYEYYLIFYFEGIAPTKYKIGKGRCGEDYGTSAVASYTGKELDFQEIAPEVKKYNHDIKVASQAYEAATRRANLECYDEKGVPIKGMKCKNWTTSRRKALMKLKYCYYRKTVYVQEWWKKRNNHILTQCDTVVSEEMNWRALAKKAKETSRQDKKSAVKKKDGTVIEVNKFKRKKRFGKSVCDRSPGFGERDLKNKIEKQGGTIIKVNNRKYRASQYHHDTDEYVPVTLDDRTKVINGETVARDTYTAFLLYNIKDTENIDREACLNDFENYLTLQSKLVENVRRLGDNTKTFGLKNFPAV